MTSSVLLSRRNFGLSELFLYFPILVAKTIIFGGIPKRVERPCRAKTPPKEASSAILRSDELARRCGIAEAVVGNAMRRQKRRGLVEHVSPRLYVNTLAHDFSARELAGILRADAYISFESAPATAGPQRQRNRSASVTRTLLGHRSRDQLNFSPGLE